MQYDDKAIRALLDKKAIEEVLVRYCRGADRGDADLIASAYHDDAVEDHGGTFLGSARDYLALLGKVLPTAGRMSHAITNMLVELADDTHATSECYILTFSRRGEGEDGYDSLTMARLIDKFEKRDGEWRIAHRRLAWEWNHEMPIRETWGRGMIAPDPDSLIRGGKVPDDILYNFSFGRD